MRLATGAVVLFVVCSVVTSIAASQTPTKKAPAPAPASMDKAAIEKAIIANENKVNDAIIKGDVAGFSALVATDGWSVDGSGVMSVAEFVKNFSQIKLEPGWKITDTKVLWIDDNSVVLSYKWTGKGTFQGQPFPPLTYASTVWTRRAGKWTAVFHMEVPVAPMPPKK